MLPDFPRAKAVLVRLVNKNLRALVNERPFIAMFKKIHFHEGRSWAGFGEDSRDPQYGFKAIAKPAEAPHCRTR